MPEQDRDECEYRVCICVPQGFGFNVLSLPESSELEMDLVEIFEALARNR
jgi:hypothetical protein